MRSLILAAVAGYGGATMAAIAAILLWTRDFETIGFGLFAPIFVFPGLVAFCVATAFPRCRRWRSALYWLLVSPFPLYFFVVALFASPHAMAEGADEMALAFAIPAAASCVACYSALQLWPRTNRCTGVANRGGFEVDSQWSPPLDR